ncbi:MAG: hypothetical protein B6D72_04155 [gamma proteobacterium symbiont of Ctena orbiculata]|nr:MAG: hypothetical protein B6D72_04155 [gamma proteobacterium symbiont of Ctena orbiculata]PVV15656.1 MAG: hypothetical protein B6D82_03155 [gamma proteobacterium symbiont of Ctena orbiculata]
MVICQYLCAFLKQVKWALVTGLPAVFLITGAMANQLMLHNVVQEENRTALKQAIASAESLDARDPNGWTALMYATKAGKSDAVSLLLTAGASPDIGDRLGRTPLNMAVSVPKKVSQLLIQAGADINQRNAGGATALMLAAGNGRQDLVSLLLDAGARLDLKDYQGNSVVDWSRRGGFDELTRRLERRLEKQDKVAIASGEEFAEDIFVDVQFPDWFKASFLDLSEDLKEALNAGKQGLMIFISTRRCSYCKAFIQNSLNRPDIQGRVETSFDVIGLEIFDDSEMIDPEGNSYRVKEFVTSNKAAYTPTLIFYGVSGRKLLKIVGYYPPDKFQKVLDYLEGKRYLHETLRSYLNRTAISSTKSTSDISVDQELFTKPPYLLDRRAGPAARPLLVVFERPNCATCERFHRQVLRDKSVRRLMREFEAVQLDASNTSSGLIIPNGERISPAQWFERLDLSYSPAILFFDESGNEVMRLDSETKRFRMEGSLQLVLEKGYLKDAQLQRWRRDKAVELFKLNASNE